MMFQFSNDFDGEVEDFLSIPLNDARGQNSIHRINRDVNSNTNIASIAKSKDCDNDLIFDDFDDEEFILSMVDNVDCTYTQNAKKFVVESNLPLRSALKDSNAFIRTANESFKCLDSYDPSVSVIVKHKTVTNERPPTSKAPKMEYERKFPGPAGLIPKKSDSCITDDILFEDICWQELIKDVSTKSQEKSKIIEEFTVVSLKRMNIIKQISRKIPFFAAIIFHLDCSSSNPTVILKDPTGEIRGTLHKDIWNQYSHLMVIGSALLLRHVSMLSFLNSRRVYLNITIKNIDTIYSIQEGGRSVLITRVASPEVPDFQGKNWKNCDSTKRSESKTLSTSDSTSKLIQSKNISTGVFQSKLSSIDNELEGIDVDSLFGEF